MGSLSPTLSLPDYLRQQQAHIEQKARAYGLDFFPVLFEMLSYEQMNEIASYGGFPTRYPHWRFGMEYERMSKSYEYGLSKIYEMVINNHPAVAYLLEGNSLVDQKLVMAHVLAHVDFFKNNFAFRVTDQGKDRRTGQSIRKWVDTMANHGAAVRRWRGRIGIEKVEEFIDSCLSLENLIDPHKALLPQGKQRQTTSEEEEEEREPEQPSLLRVDHDYMESFINPEEFVAAERRRLEAKKEEKKRFPETEERDVLGFLVEHAPLERWEREILSIIRREAHYFLPQMQTKIMNEGWATYWHSRLMTEQLCDASDIIDYADRCAGVLATNPQQLNPYKLGVELFRTIEERWNRGQFGKEWEECESLEARLNWNRRTDLGRQKIFEVRALYNDLTFIDEFLTPEFVIDQKMYAFGYNPRHERYEIETRQFHTVKERLLRSLTNAGNPIIAVQDANHGNRGELLLAHDHQGVDLRLDWSGPVLAALHRMWSRPVELHTIVEGKPTALRYDGHTHSKQTINRSA
ncbi:MAG: SpoVR family protein [Polyangiales bacterium]